ncbi:Lar family restriction alleviation protein [Acetobacter syzygii]|uniref:Lar family restriction alleviation protein n=1 Tax=Acetobacter syzygii TaxID=146476 RepID=UPI00156ED0D8|nr:restriction alleviation protein, Lar family [Acetobacter syzygii]
MSEELKSCPFCGCSSHIVWEGRKIGHAVQCRQCLALGPQCHSKSEAITAWNTRAGEKA